MSSPALAPRKQTGIWQFLHQDVRELFAQKPKRALQNVHEERVSTADHARRLIAPRAATFISYPEAIANLEGITHGLKERINLHKDGSMIQSVSAATAYAALLTAQKGTLEEINTEYLNSPVAWDLVTGLPSPPTAIADAQRFAKHCKTPVLAALINSFTRWEPLETQTVHCGTCANQKIRATEVKIFLNHTMWSQEYAVVVQQNVGISADHNHIKNHFNWKKPSGHEDIAIIYECKNRIVMEPPSGIRRHPSIWCIELNHADRFNMSCFQELLINLSKDA